MCLAATVSIFLFFFQDGETCHEYFNEHETSNKEGLKCAVAATTTDNAALTVF